MTKHRKLAAIMFTDMQGYTAMMQDDEENAIKLRNRHRDIFETCTKSHRGKIIQYFGDGTLTVFDSCVDAVECALELQKAFLEDPVIPVRMGIHVGDIVFMENDIIGDAVNIASRIESVAEPGAVFFSGHVNDQLRSHKKIETKYLKVFQFKNVKDAVPVFALVDDAIHVPEVVDEDSQGNSEEEAALNDGTSNTNRKGKLLRLAGFIFLIAVVTAGLLFTYKNSNSGAKEAQESSTLSSSIAILPIQNLSGMDQNDVLTESLTGELLQQLSNTAELGKVVPNSLVNDFLDRGGALKDLANALEVRYILEGALHHSDSLYSLDMRLVDPLKQKYIWSRRYLHISGANYKTEIQRMIGNEIVSKLNEDVKQTAYVQNNEVITENKQAYELVLKANAFTDKMDKESFYQAIPLYEKAVQLDPEFAEAYMGLGRIYAMGGIIWGVFNQELAATKAKENLQRSIELKPNLEASQFLLITKFFFEQNFGYVNEHLSLVAILPSFPDGAFYTVYCNIMGRFDESISYAEKYVKRFPEVGNGFAQLIRAHFLSGQVKKADSLMKRYDVKFKNDQFYMRDVAMVHLNMGNMDTFKNMNNILNTNFLDKAAVHLYYDAVEMTYDGAEPTKIQERLDMLMHQYDNGTAGSPAWFLAMYYLYIGDDNTAFEWLQRSHDRMEVETCWFKTEYQLQPFRKVKDPRYMAIYNKMEWPE
ncbi:adenylate/guanylate cyclase domain-containing protein [Flagellimonas sp. 2504JD1-5]